MSEIHPPLVAHIIHRLTVGGLENGLVNLINHMPPERYRHTIICMTSFTDFRERIHRKDVEVIALHKQEGKDFSVYRRLWKVLRRLSPDIVHTRNLSALESLVPATLAGVPGRIHGEHGRDIYDLDGSNFKYNLLRKAIRPFVHRHIAVSDDLANWLVNTVAVRPNRVTRIYNGVNMERFHPRQGAGHSFGSENFIPEGGFVVGTVGRLQPVKDQITLVRAFLHLLRSQPDARALLRLVIVGEGPLKEPASRLLRDAGVAHLAWLPGERKDIPEIMRGLDLFVLPSLAEGISNTILEAMATALPVVGTRVGGTPELVEEGETGRMVPSADPVRMAEAIWSYVIDRKKAGRHGRAGRNKIEALFSMKAMVDGYLAVYDAVLNGEKERGWIGQMKKSLFTIRGS